jgi:hypothetical protein
MIQRKKKVEDIQLNNVNDIKKPLIVLENDIDFWTLFLEKYPENCSVDLIVVTDDRTINKLKELQDIAEKIKPSLKIQWILGSQMIADCYKLLWPDGSSALLKEFFYEYKLIYKLLFPIYFEHFDKYIEMDDDAFIVTDPGFLYEKNELLICHDNFNRFPSKDEEFEEFEKICKKQISLADFNKRMINPGIMLWQKDIEFKNFIKDLFENEYFQSLYDLYKGKKTYYHKMFFIELQFFNFYLKTRKTFEVMERTRLITNVNIPKRFLKTPVFIHYASGKEKHTLCSMFQNYSFVDGIFTKIK